MKKFTLLLVGMAVVIVVLGAVLVFAPAGTPQPVNNTPVQPVAEGIQVAMPVPNQLVSSPLTISGTVTGDGWGGFEGQVGTVQLVYDVNGNAAGPSTVLKATSDWTKLPTTFEATLDHFDPKGAATGYLYFHNENASGEATRDKTFIVPVKFK